MRATHTQRRPSGRLEDDTVQTKFGTTCKPIANNGDGWILFRTEDGREREWHLSDMQMDGTETPEELAIIGANRPAA